MSKQMVAVFCAVTALSGCATNVRSPLLSQFDAEYEPIPGAGGGEAIKAAAFKFSGAVSPASEGLAFCVSQNVSNRGVSLQDSSRSFVGAYTGNYYSVTSQREAGGGSVLTYASKDERSVVAEGTTVYATDALIPVQRAVRFTLSAKIGESERTFYFSKLEQAQLDTGAAVNNGFNRIGAWQGANPDLALGSLRSLAESINGCLSR